MTTNIPNMVIGPNGPILPPESAILAGATADVNGAFGGGLNPDPRTPQGQIAASTTAIVGDKNNTIAAFVNGIDPAFSFGRMQDGIGRIYFIDRIPAQSTVVTAQISGLVNVFLPTGTLAQDKAGNLYASTADATIPESGLINVPFAALATGPNPCPANTLTIPFNTISGWDSINNASDGVLGRLVENRAQFEARRTASVAINSKNTVQATRGAVLAVPGVLDAYVTENVEDFSQTIGGVTVNANSIYVAVVGGAASDVAYAIWGKKPPGCNYNGATTYTCEDNNSGYTPPYPQYPVNWVTPTATPVYFNVTLLKTVGVPSDALTQIQNAILLAFSGADGGSRATIGGTLLSSRYYYGIASLGTWAEIISIDISTTSGGTGNKIGFTIGQVPATSAANITVTLQ